MNWPGETARRTSIAGDRRLDQLGVLDHHHGVGAARHHAAGGDGGRGAGPTSIFGRDARRRSPRRSAQPARRRVAGAGGVGGAQREAVDVGAVERRHVERRGHVMRQHAAERVRQATGSAASGERSRWRSKRAFASSADTTSRNCSCRARAAHGGKKVGVSWQRPHRHLRAGRIAFAFRRNQHPAVGAGQRRMRQIATASGSALPPRQRTGTTSAMPRGEATLRASCAMELLSSSSAPLSFSANAGRP